jgi:hypothetical protein
MSKQSVWFITAISLLIAILFLVFFNISKQMQYFSNVNVFAVDPYDATSSFGFQLALFSAILAGLKAFRHYKEGKIPCSSQILILRSISLSIAAIFLTLFSDAVALEKYSSVWRGSTNGQVLGLITLFFLFLSIAFFVYILNISGAKLSAFIKVKLISTLLIIFVFLYFYPVNSQTSISTAILNIVVGISLLLAPLAIMQRYFRFCTLDHYDDFIDDVLSMFKGEKLAKAVHDFFNKFGYIVIISFAIAMGILVCIVQTAGAPVKSETLLLLMTVYIGFESAVILICYVLFSDFLGIIRKE